MLRYDWALLKRLVEDVSHKKGNRQKQPLAKELIELIRERDGGKCRVCGYDKFARRLHVHHVVPNGRANEKNLLLLCHVCHEFVHMQLRFKGYAYYRPWR